jgi:hypothetical protein
MTQNKTPINFILLARFHRNIVTEDIRSALDRLKGRHRAFDVSNSLDQHNLNAPETVPYLLSIIQDCSPDDWEAVAARELAQLFAENSPRARFVLIKHPYADDLLVVCDHDGSDGISAVLLLEDLLDLLNHPNIHLTPLPIPPPVWEILPPSVTNSFSNRMMNLILMVVFSIMGLSKPKHTDSNETSSYEITSYEFTSTFTDLFVARCRKEGTSVHSAICAALLLTLDPVFAKKSDKRTVSSPVSLRNLLSPELRGCAGMFYTTAVSSVSMNSARTFWDTAREIKQQMNKAEKSPSFYTAPLVLKLLSRFLAKQPKDQESQIPKFPINYDFSVTNLGLVKSNYIQENSDSSYTMDALYGPMVNAFSGEKTVGVCTLGGNIRLVLTTFSNEMTKNVAHSLLVETAQRLQYETRNS